MQWKYVSLRYGPRWMFLIPRPLNYAVEVRPSRMLSDQAIPEHTIVAVEGKWADGDED